jgi:DNA-binding transcriptional LysR family regulator
VQNFMREFPRVEVLLLLLNRVVSLVDEGIDVGVRIAHLPDSSLRATQIGHVRRVVCASPTMLAAEGAPTEPEHLLSRQTIVVRAALGASERWSFSREGEEIVVPVRPRLVVSSVQTALDAAVASGGFVRPLSYQSEPLEEAGLLRRVLTDFEPPLVPIHLVYPAGRHLPSKTRLFIDRAIAALRGRFA